MYTIEANSVNEAFHKALTHLLQKGWGSESRNGKVLRAPEPVTTVYKKPMNRVLENIVRLPNPFFHLMESLWMLAGRNDLRFVGQYNKRMSEYSDDQGVTQPAAYGYRWRNYFGYDQIAWIVDELKHNPTSRRCVLQMWHAGDRDSESPNGDLYAALHGSKDVPCNTSVYFLVRPDGRLDMTVTNRSNDAIWGCYGANVVHMSMLHEYVALHCGLPLGTYYQVSNDLHIYLDVYTREKCSQMLGVQRTDYQDRAVPLIREDETMQEWDRDLDVFFEHYDSEDGAQVMVAANYMTSWFRNIAVPMYNAHILVRAGKLKEADEYMFNTAPMCDWYMAAGCWLEHKQLRSAK